MACSTASRSVAPSAVAKDATALMNQGWSERGTGSLRYHAERVRIRMPSAFKRRQRSGERIAWRTKPRRWPDSRRCRSESPWFLRIGRRLTRDAQCKTLTVTLSNAMEHFVR